MNFFFSFISGFVDVLVRPFPLLAIIRVGYGRIILAIVSFWFMSTNYLISGWCYAISALLDAVDGHAARFFDQSKYNFSPTLFDLLHPPLHQSKLLINIAF